MFPSLPYLQMSRIYWLSGDLQMHLSVLVAVVFPFWQTRGCQCTRDVILCK